MDRKKVIGIIIQTIIFSIGIYAYSIGMGIVLNYLKPNMMNLQCNSELKNVALDCFCIGFVIITGPLFLVLFGLSRCCKSVSNPSESQTINIVLSDDYLSLSEPQNIHYNLRPQNI